VQHPKLLDRLEPPNGKALSDTDAIIIGAGHNGLTCAAYLGLAECAFGFSSGVAWSAAFA
jgi:hypothetical protein